jgi:MATE family multidrug resistance protein
MRNKRATEEIVAYTSARSELWIILRAAFPVLVAEFARLFMIVTDTLFVGHIGAKELAAASIAGSWGWFSFTIPIGLIFALDTLVSQAFGAKNWRLIGSSFQTSLLIVTLSTIPVMVFWWFTEPLLVLLHQPPELSRLAGTYTQWSIIGMLPLAYYRTISRYLMNQWILTPAMVVGFIALMFNAGIKWFFVWGIGDWPGWGLDGAALSTSISRFIMPILLWGYVYAKKLHIPTCTGFYRESISWKNIWEYLKLGVPSMASILFENIAFEGIALLIGLLGDETILAAHSICYNVLTFSFIIPLSWSIGGQTRVGALLGAGHSDSAKKCAKMIILVSVCWMAFQAIVLYILRIPIAKAFTFDEASIVLSEKLMALTAPVAMLDGLSVTLTGILRAIGRPMPGTVAQFVAHYVFAIPLGILLTFYFEWGVYGVWVGLLVGLIMATLAVTIYVLRIDWQKATQEALDRVKIKDHSSDGFGLSSSMTEDTHGESEELQEISFKEQDNQLELEIDTAELSLDQGDE